MTEEDKKLSKELIGKTVVSKTGELIHMVLVNPTSYTEKLELEKDGEGNILIPFSAVMAVGDFMVIAEEDIV